MKKTADITWDLPFILQLAYKDCFTIINLLEISLRLVTPSPQLCTIFSIAMLVMKLTKLKEKKCTKTLGKAVPFFRKKGTKTDLN